VVDGALFLWDDGTPRAMAARNRPTPNGECVSYVYTPPEHRNHGFASAVVARLSQKILDDGKSFCTLFTDLSNPTSNWRTSWTSNSATGRTDRRGHL
jgi:predicted GNAT family acetyltransferase